MQLALCYTFILHFIISASLKLLSIIFLLSVLNDYKAPLGCNKTDLKFFFGFFHLSSLSCLYLFLSIAFFLHEEMERYQNCSTAVCSAKDCSKRSDAHYALLECCLLTCCYFHCHQSL